jgi:hypothetical protein
VKETAARDGLMKMKTVYEANPALGDPMSIQVQVLSCFLFETFSPRFPAKNFSQEALLIFKKEAT